MKPLPVPADEIRALAERVPTPFHLYDETGMLANVRHMQAAFSWHPAFKEYFAVKACPNPHIMRSLASVGVGHAVPVLRLLIVPSDYHGSLYVTVESAFAAYMLAFSIRTGRGI